MFKGKTKKGVEINRLEGVSKRDNEKIWRVVIDRSQIRIFESKNEGGKQKVAPIAEIAWKPGRAKARDLVTDRPGRSFNSFTKARKGQTSSPRHSMGSDQDPKQHELELFLRKGGDYLVAAKNKDLFDLLVLYSESKVLGTVKKVFPKTLLRVVKDMEAKDYAWLTNRQLEARLTTRSAA